MEQLAFTREYKPHIYSDPTSMVSLVIPPTTNLGDLRQTIKREYPIPPMTVTQCCCCDKPHDNAPAEAQDKEGEVQDAESDPTTSAAIEVKCDPAAELGSALTDEHTIYWKHAFASAQLEAPTSQAAERTLAHASCAEFLRCKLDVGWLSDRGIPKKEKERFIQLWHRYNDG